MSYMHAFFRHLHSPHLVEECLGQVLPVGRRGEELVVLGQDLKVEGTQSVVKSGLLTQFAAEKGLLRGLGVGKVAGDPAEDDGGQGHDCEGRVDEDQEGRVHVGVGVLAPGCDLVGPVNR